MISKVQSRCSRLLDHRHFRYRITRIPYIAMLGSPKEGGFGLMPFEQHVQSRHACLLMKTLNLLFQYLHHPYAFLVLDLLSHHSPTYIPLLFLLWDGLTNFSETNLVVGLSSYHFLTVSNALCLR
jgi:hypothetical protein